LFGVFLASENQDYLKKPPHFLSFATKFQKYAAIASPHWPLPSPVFVKTK